MRTHSLLRLAAAGLLAVQACSGDDSSADPGIRAGDTTGATGGSSGASAAGGQGMGAAGAAGAPGGGSAGSSGSDSGSSGASGQAGASNAGGTGGDTSAAGSSGASGSAGGTSTVCPAGLPGPALVLIPAGPGQAYCIDQTEVTVGQYQAFLDTKPALPQTQPPMCKDNVTYFGPTKEVEESAFAAIDPVNHPDEPMGMVDWCDAYAYCAWAGKRLCGKVGGGPVGQIGEYATVASEWYNACSNGGKTKYPYGDSFDVSKCWVTGHEGAPADSAKPVPASSDAVAACHGQQAPYSEIVNLSGNVYEWENSLDPSEASAQSYYSASALIRGGVVGSDAAQVQLETSCAFGGRADRALLARGVGLRCCADAVPLP